MKAVLIGIFVTLLAAGAPAQRTTAKATPPSPAAAAKPKPAPEPSPSIDPAVAERELFDAAHNASILADRVSLLEQFVARYPSSERIPEARESLMIARSSYADERLDAGDVSGAIGLFKKTIVESPQDSPDQLLGEIIVKMPGNLYSRGHRTEAFEVASFIEDTFPADAGRLASLANFYLAVESGDDALRVARKAIEADPNSSAGYQALGMAYRLNFEFEASAEAFGKAAEADPASVRARHGLADLQRALGRSEEAAAIFRQLLAENENDLAARSGLTLALFEAGKRAEAETELASTLERAPNNVPLLSGAAYWYAANGDGARAVELARRAIGIEPRYVWAHIALARGEMATGRPVDAEKTLTAARRFGNFPTLNYEIAAARFKAGFFKEAIEELDRSFSFAAGEARTRLGGRIERSGSDLAELVAAERKAGFLAPRGPDDQETAKGLAALKALLDAAEDSDPDRAASAADRFVGGEDPMRTHRALFAADLLLSRRIAPDKALLLAGSAMGTAENALSVPEPAAAVMASELYAARTIAASREEFLLVPSVPRATLLAILRGRVEELAGWAMLEKGEVEGAAVRFRRALSVLPEKSAWWRSAKWRLGTTLAAEGKDAEALEHYVESYDPDRPDIVKYIVVDALYRKVNGSAEGLESKIGRSPLPPSYPATPQPASDPVPDQAPEIRPDPPKRSDPVSPAAETPVPTVPVETKAEEPKAEERKFEPEPETSRETPQPEPRKDDPSPAEPRPDEKEPPPTAEKGVPADTRPETSPQPSPEPERPAVPDEKRPEPVRSSPIEEARPETPPGPDPNESPSSRTESEKPAPIPIPSPEEQLPETRTAPKENDEKPVISPQPETPLPPEKAEPEIEKAEPVPSEPLAAEKPAERLTAGPDPEKRNTPPRSSSPRLVIEDATNARPSGRDQQRNERSATSQRTDRPLFETVVIEAPTVRSPKAAAETSAAETKADEDPAAPAREPAQLRSQARTSEWVRPRVVITDALPASECTISTSQERLSLINGGGTIGVLVTLEGEGDVRSIRAVPSSSEDIEVRAEPGITRIRGRAYYVVRSTSTRTGMYQVTFTAPCGKKELIVQVR